MNDDDFEVIVKVSVYYTYSHEKFAELYDKLRDKQYPHYEFVLESKEKTVD